jgi:hypothetical protein
VLAGLDASVMVTVQLPPLGPGTVPVKLNAVKVMGIGTDVTVTAAPVGKTASSVRWTMVSVLPNVPPVLPCIGTPVKVTLTIFPPIGSVASVPGPVCK